MMPTPRSTHRYPFSEITTGRNLMPSVSFPVRIVYYYYYCTIIITSSCYIVPGVCVCVCRTHIICYMCELFASRQQHCNSIYYYYTIAYCSVIIFRVIYIYIFFFWIFDFSAASMKNKKYSPPIKSIYNKRACVRTKKTSKTISFARRWRKT